MISKVSPKMLDGKRLGKNLRYPFSFFRRDLISVTRRQKTVGDFRLISKRIAVKSKWNHSNERSFIFCQPCAANRSIDLTFRSSFWAFKPVLMQIRTPTSSLNSNFYSQLKRTVNARFDRLFVIMITENSVLLLVLCFLHSVLNKWCWHWLHLSTF